MIPSIISDDELNKAINIATTTVKQPNKTYKFDFDSGEMVSGFIDSDEAIQQAVTKAVLTIRDRYFIYSSDYGCEIQYMMGTAHSLDYLKLEIPRLIKDALIVDDRIHDCTDFVVTKDGGIVNVSFTVISDVQSLVKVEVSI